MLATGLARFSQIGKDTRGTVDAVARRKSRADQSEKPLILQRSIGEGVTQPFDRTRCATRRGGGT